LEKSLAFFLMIAPWALAIASVAKTTDKRKDTNSSFIKKPLVDSGLTLRLAEVIVNGRRGWLWKAAGDHSCVNCCGNQGRLLISFQTRNASVAPQAMPSRPTCDDQGTPEFK
jgi:hypothetical protein